MLIALFFPFVCYFTYIFSPFFETYGRLIKKYPDKILKHMTSYHAFFTTLFFIINIYKHERPLRREKWISWPYLTLTSLTPLDCLTSWPPWHLQDDKNYFRSEAALLQQLHHPRVVLMMGVCTTAARPFMLLEYLAGGTLYNLIHNSPWVEGAVFIFFPLIILFVDIRGESKVYRVTSFMLLSTLDFKMCLRWCDLFYTVCCANITLSYSDICKEKKNQILLYPTYMIRHIW